MTARFTFSGGKELEAALREIGSAAAGRLGVNATKAGARVIAAAARARVPVDEGVLKKSITVVGDDDLRRSGGSTRAAYATAVPRTLTSLSSVQFPVRRLAGLQTLCQLGRS
jgi:Bacteriophage HK97-gp10, putative tail-component